MKFQQERRGNLALNSSLLKRNSSHDTGFSHGHRYQINSLTHYITMFLSVIDNV